MKIPNSPILTLLTLAGVCWLSWYTTPRTDMHGNKLEDVQAFYDSLKPSDEEILDIYEGE